MSEARPRLLDLTRLVSRSGRGLTGVDRVELAYATALSARGDPIWALVRTSLGFLLLDRRGLDTVVAATRTGDWGRPDLLSRLSLKLDRARQAGQSHARAQAIARCLPRNLGRMLKRHLPSGISYLNVGHSNFDRQVFAAVRTVPDARVTVMIHDTIPLDLPDLQRPGSVDAFGHKLRLAALMADRILTPTEASRADILRHLGDGCPPVIAAHLGVEAPAAERLPDGIDLSRPLLVVLGTIEPRKNHALLLDIWEEFDGKGPQLFICGRRGWRNEDVFARLDAGLPRVTELGGLTDGQVRTLLEQAQALLFPSLAEGYGLPAIEAAALGVPVICSDLAVFRETLGNAGVYLPVTDRYLWKKTLEEYSRRDGSKRVQVQGFKVQTWDNHFRIALRDA